MSQKEKLIAKLILKYIEGSCSVREIRKLNNWIESDIKNKEFFIKVIDPSHLQKELDILNSFDGEKSWSKRQKAKKLGLRRFIKSWSIAASILVILSTLTYINKDILSFHKKNSNSDLKEQKVSKLSDKNPASLGAKLEFPDGSTLQLTQPLKINSNGDFYSINNKLISENSSQELNEEIKWFKINVPVNQFYSIQLPDGSSVWLNSNSEIQFPSRFDLKERIISMKGEAYFEIKKLKNQSFTVKTDQANIRVLGTSFNLNNYKNKLFATLAEGKIDIQTRIENRILHPNQKASISNDSIAVIETNLKKELAWKDNQFYFQNDSLEEILFQIENWYGLKTNYQSFKSDDQTFSGTINRDVNLSQFLEILSRTSIYTFKISENNLIINSKK